MKEQVEKSSDIVELAIPLAYAGYRLDQALAELLTDYSRSRLQQWIKQGQVLVDGVQIRPRDRLNGGEQVRLETEIAVDERWVAQEIPLNIVFEDEDLLVLNKPAGLVVHPAVGNADGTLLNGLLHYDAELIQMPRAGIVHRLDKDTSGIMVVAKSLRAHTSLVNQLQTRSLSRQYQCVVHGVMTAGGTVDAPIGRHPVDRKRMAVVDTGKEAVTHYRVADRYRAHSLVSVSLETGRTHQIRVHMAHIHYPVVGDPVYSGRLRTPPACSEAFIEVLHQFRRQALHAFRLGLIHPASGEEVSWEVPMAEDMQKLIDALVQDREAHRDAE